MLDQHILLELDSRQARRLGTPISPRCIIPASEFFELTSEKKDRVPHFFSAADGDLLAFAARWESWRNPETCEDITTCRMIVREANASTARHHDCMPCMLLRHDFEAWLDGSLT